MLFLFFSSSLTISLCYSLAKVNLAHMFSGRCLTSTTLHTEYVQLLFEESSVGMLQIMSVTTAKFSDGIAQLQLENGI